MTACVFFTAQNELLSTWDELGEYPFIIKRHTLNLKIFFIEFLLHIIGKLMFGAQCILGCSLLKYTFSIKTQRYMKIFSWHWHHQSLPYLFEINQAYGNLD